MNGSIIIKGANVNNLHNLDLEIPRGQFVVITGISGSGKSSLAFDTLFAEGQRRFAQSLSSYARQFLGRMSKPDVESIEGIPPAIAIEQKVNTKNPRSTVATTTEIYDFVRLAYARIGRTYSPVSGQEVRKDSVKDVLDYLCNEVPAGRISYILANIDWRRREDKVELMLGLKEDGYGRLWADGHAMRIEEMLKRDGDYPQDAWLLIDRWRSDAGTLDEDTRTRLLSSIADAFERGRGDVAVAVEAKGSGTSVTTAEAAETAVALKRFCSRFELDGILFREPDEFLFSFNSPLGACPVCGGLGKIIGVSEDLVIPDKSLSIYDGAIACWRGDKMGWFRERLISLSEKLDIPIFEPWCNLPQRVKDMIWEGVPSDNEEETLVGINEFFRWVETQRYKIQYKYMLSRFSGRTTCHSCHGSRLRPEASYVRICGKTISEVLSMNIEQAIAFFENLELTDSERAIVEEPLQEILSRLRYISDVGLAYLTLDRACNTLSGGESQRINLVTALGSSLVGSMYILDEPSIGLHPRDTERLISVLKRLRDLGNTVIVVEHDEEIIRAADMLIDMGPKAGTEGGRIVFRGKAAEASPSEIEASTTLQYLSGMRPRLTRRKRAWSHYISVEGAMEHNLRDITVRFPLGVLTVVSGVSGSGKSSLVGDILYPALFRHINETGSQPGTFRRLGGDLGKINRVEYVDQNPIGKSSRSNAATYLKIYDDIRKLLADQQYAKINGYGPSTFSFNQEGGRCPECQGDGRVKIEMQFMADITMVCEACGGKRFKADVLEVRYRGKNVDDILQMSIDEAALFFGEDNSEISKRIVRRLAALQDVGLGYIKLGQSSSTLSGGESQRIKLAYFLSLSRESGVREKEHIMFIFDEPTTGLHFYDVEKLLKAFETLLDAGHTLVVVEHNLDVIKAADWVIDLGPEAGDKGGEIVFEGTPEDLAESGKGYTSLYIK